MEKTSKAARKSRKKRLKFLRRGRTRGVGLIAGIRQWLAGRRDGRMGLPREDGDRWSSPHLEREVHACEEAFDRQWGTHQIESEQDCIALSGLIEDIGHTMTRLDEAETTLRGFSVEVRGVRRRGEESMTESQVIGRRTRERDRRVAIESARARDLQETLQRQTASFSELYNRMQEEIRSNQLICNRLESRTRQRLDVYWMSAMKRHPRGDEMPIAPVVEVAHDAEARYFELHEDLLARAENLHRFLIEQAMEAEKKRQEEQRLRELAERQRLREMIGQQPLETPDPPGKGPNPDQPAADSEDDNESAAWEKDPEIGFDSPEDRPKVKLTKEVA